jgi:uncharacterized protein (TIGR02453 family)
VAFRGWPAEALEFYEGLAADNSKSYWTAHRTVYDEQVHAPMVELLAELEPQFGAGKIFRPYRDVRFSKDKSPYKLAIGATLERGGYVQLSAEGLAAGCGMYRMAPDQLTRYREMVAADVTGGLLDGIVAELRANRIAVEGHDVLKSAPRGFSKDHPRIDLLRYRGIIAWKEWPVAAWLGTATPKKRLAEFFRQAEPLNAWLADHVGDSELEPER